MYSWEYVLCGVFKLEFGSNRSYLHSAVCVYNKAEIPNIKYFLSDFTWGLSTAALQNGILLRSSELQELRGPFAPFEVLFASQKALGWLRVAVGLGTLGSPKIRLLLRAW